jgi:hypothetical protein
MSRAKVTMLFCLAGCLIAIAGCDRKPRNEAPTEPRTAPDPKDAGAATTQDATTTPGMDPMADPGMDPMAEVPQPYPVVAAASCDGKGKQLSRGASAASFKREGNVWSRKETWSGGCPKGPVFTLAYRAKSSPLEVRLCFDQGKDACEAVKSADLRWDLTAPLKEAGATEVRWVD